MKLRWHLTKIGGFFLAGLLALPASPAWAGKAVIFPGHENGRVKGFDQVNVEMFRPHPLGSVLYSETWGHLLQFEAQDIILIVAFQLHNLGLRRGNLNVSAIVSDGSAEKIFEVNYFTPGEIKIVEQGFGISAGDHRIELLGDRYRIRFQGKKIQAEFLCPILTGSFQLGDGRLTFPDSEDFARLTFPIPWAEAEGTLTYNGKTFTLKGWCTMTHDGQVLSPARVMNDGRAFWLYTDQAVILADKLTSPALEGQWVQRLILAEPGRILFSSHEFTLEELDSQPVPAGRVPLPSRFRVEAVHGEDWLRGEIKVRRIQQKADVMAELPGFLKKLVEMFMNETWAYLLWVDFRFEFHQDGKTRVIEGVGSGNYIESIKTSP